MSEVSKQSVFGSQLLMIWCLGSLPGTVASAADAARAPEKNEKVEFYVERLRDHRLFAEGSNKSCQLVANPLMRFDNPVSKIGDGMIFLWTDAGRPVAVMKSYYNLPNGTWGRTFVSLATGPLELRVADKPLWTPRAAGVAFKALAGVPVPSEKPESRLIQMRELARKFQVVDNWGLKDPTDWQLRVLPTPLYRYEVAQDDVVDGALFAYVLSGPEALLLLEAQRTKDGLQWRYAASRCTRFGITFSFQEAKVAEFPRLDAWPANATYFHYPLPMPDYPFGDPFQSHDDTNKARNSAMQDRRRQFAILVAYLAWLACLGSRIALAQQTAADAKTEPAPFLEEARRYSIESLKERATLRLYEKSLFNWTNPTRQQERGAIFVWSHEERPLAIGSLFTYEYNGKVYTKHELHSLSTGGLRATLSGTLAWNPQTAGIAWKDLPNSPAPGKTHVARLLQIRQLARTFRAELIDPKDQKTELRLAPRPLLEYAASEAWVTDGAIFSFVVATDPEALLLIEAFEEIINATPRTGFRYAFARFHYWNLVAYDGEKKVWEAPLDRAHELNYLGDAENIGKVYNSFHPYPRGSSQ